MSEATTARRRDRRAAAPIGPRACRSWRSRSTPGCSAWSAPSPSSGSASTSCPAATSSRPRNLWNLSVQSSSIAIMATGMVLIIVSRNIDLSVGSMLGFIG